MAHNHHYEPLDSSQQQIRVLWLLSATETEHDINPEPEIEATLTIVSLSDQPAYNALSYTWDSPDGPVHQIRLNGHPYAVRPNLHNCLVHLRKRGLGSEVSGIPLWIDALCISQDDVAEKTSQLRLMGDVYRRAASVISWLGSDDRLVQGMGAIVGIAREWARFRDKLKAVSTPGSENDGPSELGSPGQPVPDAVVHGWLRETEHLSREKDERRSGMVHLFQSEYWRRVWITQELLLADPDAHIYICGTASATEAELDRLTDCILTAFGGDKPEVVGVECWNQMALGVRGELAMRTQLSAIQLGQAAPSLMFVLYISNTRAATDPRDVVYGLLHLIPNHGIVPDYRKAVWEVYAEWAVAAMLEAGNMELLSHVATEQRRRSNIELDLPSWVPDICNYKGYRIVDWQKKSGSPQGSPAGGFAVQVLNNGRVLKVEARRADTVKKVTRLRRFTEAREQWDWDMVRFCMDYMVEQQASGRCYPTGIPPLQALVRLVMRQRIAAARPEEYPKHIHEVAGGFIAWLVTGFSNMFSAHAPKGEPLKIAASLLGLEWGGRFPKTYEMAVFPGVDVRELMGWNQLTDAFPDGVEAVQDHMINWCDGPTLVETEEGYIGHAPRNAEVGDHIFVVRHCKAPLIFRPSELASRFVTLIGDCDLLQWESREVGGNVDYEKLLVA
ncbi:heterokaryon incompatibility protein-domain-containing protein [Staphylotrichum tortipilum]|uniref:Heterokaryon incompatibility protein-domain-containing protein n=1 Tax=Staphylotrichum tortipilum TaxID=2831512 RepID=A0AAN6MT52_9PEZI|nr:heterokaryon incompatibility protein-domain-containing protein [Staphylotrichum longicolle]